jgi:cobaltochelatase CobN
VIGSEIIPASDLKRPRVDVVLSATGLYRDAFPNVMQWLAKAIEKVVKLKEESNSLWRNAQRISKDLQESGVEAEDAEYLSSVRIFSNESGNYGSGLGQSTVNSDEWDDDSRLANLYLSRMGYFYGADNSKWGVKRDDITDLYARQLSGTDVAVFSRSSNIYGLMSSDDPFQYFGGLALAVRSIDGKSPEMMISNLRNAEKGKVESAAKFMAKELRTRDYHPRWLEEMQKEGYSGATTMASRVSNFFGWQVMDPNIVRDDQWQELFEVYVQDKHELGLSEWFEEVDPKAQQQIIERMLEAIRKEYWAAADDTREKLVERYDELVNRHDLVVENEKLKEFVEQTASGFGLDVALPGPPAVSVAVDMPQQVQGQKLEKVEASSTDADHTQLYAMLAACLLMFAAGGLRQWFMPTRSG